MPVTDYDALDALCTACGISGAYQDIWGNYQQPTIETKQSLLKALGLSVDDNDDVHRALQQQHFRGWDRIVAAVLVVAENESPIRLTLTLESAQAEKALSWELIEESGEVRHGDWIFDETDTIAERRVDDILLKRFEVTLPCSPDTGYHRLTIASADGDETQTSLIVTPKNCYQLPELGHGRKLWGVALQLYALGSHHNWGIGDFADLHLAIDSLAPLGVNIIGLNPLHALFPHLPEQASPYCPTSRNFLNPVYLNIEAIEEFECCEEVQQLVASKEFQARLKTLRKTELVDYSGVWHAKLTALKMLYRSFRHRHISRHSSRAKVFRQFQAEGGEDLRKFGLFEALQAQLHQQDASIGCWLLWPERYRDPESGVIADWEDLNREEIEFYQYLQWNAQLQLAEVQRHCIDCGMTIGIYRDLAVGVAKASAQTWSAQSLYALDSSIGAPPDNFNLQGQDWSLPPPKPQVLIDEAYDPFIKTLRTNMRHAGAVRIDHVMGLMRLFWIPPNGLADAGSYVAYPFADLLGILALESQRNRCMVIGEDLGTVPDEVRAALQLKKVFSYRILYFEKNWQEGSFKPPSGYPQLAVATVGSHDLPTLRGFWQGYDLDLSEKLDLFPSPEHQDQQRQARDQDRIEIVDALVRENLILREAINEEQNFDDLSTELILSVHRFLARSEATLMLVQLEDLFGQKDQINLPGTVHQHPNWRRKLPVNIEDWLDEGNLEFFAQAIAKERETLNQ